MAGSGTSFTGRIVDRLGSWPGLSVVRADCGVGPGLAADGCQIAHLHTEDEAELRLTEAVIDRLGEALTESGQVSRRPGGDWVRVRLDTESDVALVMSLISVAIKAAGDAPPSPRTRRTPTCGAASPAANHGRLRRRLSAALTGDPWRR